MVKERGRERKRRREEERREEKRREDKERDVRQNVLLFKSENKKNSIIWFAKRESNKFYELAKCCSACLKYSK